MQCWHMLLFDLIYIAGLETRIAGARYLYYSSKDQSASALFLHSYNDEPFSAIRGLSDPVIHLRCLECIVRESLQAGRVAFKTMHFLLLAVP